MLRKLLKYEFKATGRSIIPLYGALLILALVIRIFVVNNINSNFSLLSGNINLNLGVLSGLFNALSIFLYGATMAATAVATILIIVYRFYKNLLGDEGYLMNTLPVSIHSNIVSKIITSIAWCCLSAVIAAISILIIASNNISFSNFISDIFNLLGSAFNAYGFNVPLILLEFVLSGISQIALNIILIYTSISLGHMLPKIKILGSFAAYLAISTAMTIIMTTAASICFRLTSFNLIFERLLSNSPIICTHIFGTGFFLINMAWFVILYITTHYILKNKLNLE